MSLAVGIDVVDVADVERSIDRFGDRYLTRVFTQGELDGCGRRAASVWLSACLAAKEATMKVMHIDDDEPIDWRSIEVLSPRSADAGLALHDSAAELAEQRGMRSFAVSIDATDSHATAVVIAEIAQTSTR